MKLLQFKKSPYFHTGLYLEYSPTFLTPITKCEGYGTHRTDWVHDKNTRTKLFQNVSYSEIEQSVVV